MQAEPALSFVFTDVEGSTEMWDDEPEAMTGALEVHDRLLAAAMTARGGEVVKSTGDGMLAAFVDAASAVMAAVDAQRALGATAWPTVRPVRVRIGIHTGMATWRNGDYFGTEVNRAARIMDAGHGGQILVSEATWTAAAGGVEPDVGSQALGVHHLKGLRTPEQLLQITAAGLASTFRDLRTTHLVAHNLPVERTPLVGRVPELARLDAALAGGPVVTLTGTGGVGKSCLARAAARSWLGRRPDGVFLVGLGPIEDPDLIVGRVASAIDMPTGGSPVDRDTLLTYLGPLSLLLVIDDVEHLIDAVAALVDEMTAAAPNLLVLVTSREALGIAGEQVLGLEPLEVGDADSPAVQLFLERAAAAGSAEVDPAAAAALCRHLDGLPLAIELAAGNAAHLDPSEILAQLGAGVPLGSRQRLTSGRWRSLEDTVAWSYDLLDAEHQAAFRAVSVFNGGFSAEQAAAILPEEVDAVRATALLADLAGASLVSRRRSEAGTAFAMLGVLRTFARDRAERAAETGVLGARHRDWFLAESEAPSWPVRCNSTRRALAAEASLDDHRAAIAFSAAEGRDDLALRQTTALCGLWWMLPYADEGGSRLEALPVPDDDELAAATLLARAATAVGGDNFIESRSLLARATERATGRRFVFEPMIWGFRAVTELGRLEAGLALLADGRRVDTTGSWAPFLDHFEGDLYLMQGDAEAACDLYDRALAAYDWDEYLWWATAALSCQATAHHLRGEEAAAIEIGRAAVDLAAGEPRLLSASARAVVLAYPLAAGGDFAAAADLLLSCLAEAHEQRHLTWALGEPLGGVAALAHHHGDDELAGELLGVIEREGLALRSPWQFALHVQYVREHQRVDGTWPPPGALGVEAGLARAGTYLAGLA